MRGITRKDLLLALRYALPVSIILMLLLIVVARVVVPSLPEAVRAYAPMAAIFIAGPLVGVIGLFLRWRIRKHINQSQE